MRILSPPARFALQHTFLALPSHAARETYTGHARNSAPLSVRTALPHGQFVKSSRRLSQVSSPSKKSSPLLINSPLERAQKRKGSTQHGFRRPDTLSPATRFFSSDVQDGACGPLSPHRRALVVVSRPPRLKLSSPLVLPRRQQAPALDHCHRGYDHRTFLRRDFRGARPVGAPRRTRFAVCGILLGLWLVHGKLRGHALPGSCHGVEAGLLACRNHQRLDRGHVPLNPARSSYRR